MYSQKFRFKYTKRMRSYVVFIRGINVSGKNKVTMADLRGHLEELGFSDISTYIASGNIILKSDKTSQAIKTGIERMLPMKFKLDSELIKILVLSPAQLRAVIDHRPAGFGDEPDKYHSDVIFLIDIDPATAMSVFSPLEGVDKVQSGTGVIYSQRLSSRRTSSRLNKIIGTPAYQSMTTRNWSTTTKLLEILEKTNTTG